MAYYTPSNDSDFSDDFLDNSCYAVGLIVALIGLFVLILSILAKAPEFTYLYEINSRFTNHNFLMHGIGLMMYGMIIFFSDTIGLPFLLPLSYELVFIKNKFIRIFEILSGIFIILLYLFWIFMIILNWI